MCPLIYLRDSPAVEFDLRLIYNDKIPPTIHPPHLTLNLYSFLDALFLRCFPSNHSPQLMASPMSSMTEMMALKPRISNGKASPKHCFARLKQLTGFSTRLCTWISSPWQDSPQAHELRLASWYRFDFFSFFFWFEWVKLNRVA